MKKNKRKHNYIKETEEWQEHQYDPGYYTGGKIPPALKNEGNSPLLGWGLLYFGIGSALIIVLTIWKLTDTSQLLKSIAAASLWELLAVAMLVGGIRSLKKAYAHNKKAGIRAVKKNITVLAIILCLIAAIEIGAQALGQVQETMVIYPNGQVCPSYSDGKYYMNIRDRNMHISCSEEQHEELRKFIINGDHVDYTYTITFKWNKLNPKQGRLIKFERSN